ncbi:MAG: hypothetical protein ACKVOH_02440 [Chlamydiales bacterium]
MKIDILVADNTYGTARHFAKGLQKGLLELGHEAPAHWIGEGHFYHALAEMQKSPPDFTLSFSIIEGLENAPFPHFTYLFDPVVYFLPLLLQKNHTLSCQDREEATIVGRLFLPHAVCPSLMTSPDKEREYDAVFFGSCIDIDALIESWGENSLFLDVAMRVLTSPLSILEALREAKFRNEEIVIAFEQVDAFVRGFERIALLKQFPEACIWGNGPWKKYLPDAVIFPATSFSETIEIMRCAKRVLNTSTTIKQGLHERILTALACGAQPITANNGVLAQEFSTLPTFPQGEWEEAPEIRHNVQSILDAQTRILARHTWKTRAEKIVEHMK